MEYMSYLFAQPRSNQQRNPDMLHEMDCRPRRSGFAGLCFVLASCSFDTSNSIVPGDGSTQERIDAGRADAIDPRDCPEPIHIEVQVNGSSTVPPSGEPYVHSLLGDTVELSAIGTCTQTGTIEYAWTIEPVTIHLNATALPNLSSETVSVYSTLADTQHTVRLRVSDGSTSLTKVFYAFDVAEFVNLPSIPENDIKAVHAGANFLWVGGKQGAYRTELASPGTLTDISEFYSGENLPPNVAAIYESTDGALAWFGTSDAEGRVYRLSTGTDTIGIFGTIVGSKTRAFSDAGTGVRVGTDQGVALAPNNQDFSIERGDAVTALSVGGQGAFAGDTFLYPLPTGSNLNVFSTGNNKISGIADDGARLWVAGDGKGVATVINGSVGNVYTTANSDLISNGVRALAVDASGDIWASTQAGVARFKADRQVWVPLDNTSGLGARSDLKVITIDESSGRRAIYVGGKNGLSMMAAP